MTVFLYVGTTAPQVADTLREVKSDGSLGPLDLTTVTVRFRMRSQFASVPLIDAPATIVAPLLGEVRYDWILADTTTTIGNRPGPYLGWWHLDYGGGVTLDGPEFSIQFLDHSPSRGMGPCTDFCAGQDVVACFSDVETDACLSSAVRMASEVLYALSANKFPGWCQSVIRPCQNMGCWGGGPMGVQFLDRGHVIWTGRGWESDQGDPCACGAWLQKIRMPGTAQEIIEVMISGVVLDPSAYRLDPDSSLLRTDGGAWPICQNLAADGDAPGAFQVTYGHGYRATELGKRAAAQLAREFWLVCSGQDCALPAGVVELVRQGVTVRRVADMWSSGATGLALVDSFIATYGETKPAPLTMSPETVYTDRRTQ